MNATKTGRLVNVYGTKLAEINVALGDHDVVTVDGVAFYTHDLGGFIVGSREATSTDYGGNDVGRGTRTAPHPLDGMAATIERGARPTRIRYSEPEIVGAGHCD
jgi:hypothetical protein